jgi:hypothetical protein
MKKKSKKKKKKKSEIHKPNWHSRDKNMSSQHQEYPCHPKSRVKYRRQPKKQKVNTQRP